MILGLCPKFSILPAAEASHPKTFDTQELRASTSFCLLQAGSLYNETDLFTFNGRTVPMARSDLIVELVRAGVKGDEDAVRTVAEKLAADERAKRHGVVAERITKALNSASRPAGSGNGRNGALRVRDDSGGISRREPDRRLDDIYLAKKVRTALDEFIEEQRRADILRAHGIEPRHRLLLVGPPGNGKTSLAECIAYELVLPLFTIRYETVITSYLGETAQRLRRVFDYVRTEPCVLFFDEFDAIGKERGDLHETGEIKRVVTTLLLQLDDLPSYCVLVGATNHPELLDRASWRRFELSLEIPAPSNDQMTTYFADWLRTLGHNSRATANSLRKQVNPSSFSEAEEFFKGVQRTLILSQGTRSIQSILKNKVQTWETGNYKIDGLNSDGRKDDSASDRPGICD